MADKKDIEVWEVKENGGEGDLVGIMTNKSKWFIAEAMLLKHAELVCELFNNPQKRRQQNDTT